MRKYSFLKGFEKEMNAAADMAGIDLEDGPELLDCYFKAIDFLMDDERIPEIQVQSLGVLKFNKKRVLNGFKDRPKSMIRIKDETIRRYTKQINIIEERLERESKGERGIGYWWSFVPKNFITQLIEKEDGGIQE